MEKEKKKRKSHFISDETRKKQREIRLQWWREQRAKGIVPAVSLYHKGKHLTEEHRKKVSEGVKKLWQDPEYRAKILSKRVPTNQNWTVERKSKSISTRMKHAQAVLEEMAVWEKEGYRCFPVGATELGIPTPDFIAVKGDNIRAFANEVEFHKIKPNRYKDCKYYDDIVWILRSHRFKGKEIKTSRELAEVLGVGKRTEKR